MVLKFAHLLEKHMEDRLKGLRSRYEKTREPREKADLVTEMRTLGMVKASIANAREEFMNDSVNYHRRRLHEILEISESKRPRPSRRKT